jgi:hypothetical protein
LKFWRAEEGLHRQDAKGAKEEKEWKRDCTAKTRRARRKRRKRRIGRSGRGIAPLRCEGHEGRVMKSNEE